MHVLNVVAHPKPGSFTHALARRFEDGVTAAGHSFERADLYAEGFDPVMTARDMEQFVGREMPGPILAEQDRVERADALCLIFPVWWFSMPAMMKGWLDRVWSAGWAYAWQHDPKGSLLKPRPCTLLVPVGAYAQMEAEWGCLERLDHIWRVGVLGYCGVDPIDIRFLLDSAFDKGEHEKHLATAYEAGKTICDGVKA